MEDEARIALRSSRLSWREMDDQVVVLDTERSTYLRVNGSGALLWGQLVAGATLGELVAAVREVYDVDDATALADVERFVSDLRARDLLA